ncbi:hypothetical protein D3C71_1098390 [compost metagenome]
MLQHGDPRRQRHQRQQDAVTDHRRSQSRGQPVRDRQRRSGDHGRHGRLEHVDLQQRAVQPEQPRQRQGQGRHHQQLEQQPDAQRREFGARQAQPDRQAHRQHHQRQHRIGQLAERGADPVRGICGHQHQGEHQRPQRRKPRDAGQHLACGGRAVATVAGDHVQAEGGQQHERAELVIDHRIRQGAIAQQRAHHRIADEAGIGQRHADQQHRVHVAGKPEQARGQRHQGHAGQHQQPRRGHQPEQAHVQAQARHVGEHRRRQAYVQHHAVEHLGAVVRQRAQACEQHAQAEHGQDQGECIESHRSSLADAGAAPGPDLGRSRAASQRAQDPVAAARGGRQPGAQGQAGGCAAQACCTSARVARSLSRQVGSNVAYALLPLHCCGSVRTAAAYQRTASSLRPSVHSASA